MKEELKEYLKSFPRIWDNQFNSGVSHAIGCIEMKIKELEWEDKDDWNNAIEEAAKIVDKCNRDGPYNAIIAAPIIRKLKK